LSLAPLKFVFVAQETYGDTPDRKGKRIYTNRSIVAGWPLSRRILNLAFLLAISLGGCAYVPNVGPTTSEVRSAVSAVPPDVPRIQIIDVDSEIARQLAAQRTQRMFSETLSSGFSDSHHLGPGDVVEVNIWEAPPATLFGVTTTDSHGQIAGAHPTTLPEQMIDSDGLISVPFAGKIKAAGRTLDEVEDEIVHRLVGKANQPEVIVRLTRNATRNVTVVGEVATSLRVPLTPGHERLLDALAAAGGVRQPVNKMTIQVTRGDDVQSLPLETIIRDPKQNVPLKPGDVVTALFESFSFNALGATGKNQEVTFETQGISLAQALARSGGLVDAQSDPRGVFIFRFEKKDALSWPAKPVAMTAEGLVPVIYRINLKDPNSFFVMQNFAMNNKDLLYVSDAPVAELQKFMNIVFSFVYPLLNAKQSLGL